LCLDNLARRCFGTPQLEFSLEILAQAIGVPADGRAGLSHLLTVVAQPIPLREGSRSDSFAGCCHAVRLDKFHREVGARARNLVAYSRTTLEDVCKSATSRLIGRCLRGNSFTRYLSTRSGGIDVKRLVEIYALACRVADGWALERYDRLLARRGYIRLREGIDVYARNLLVRANLSHIPNLLKRKLTDSIVTKPAPYLANGRTIGLECVSALPEAVKVGIQLLLGTRIFATVILPRCGIVVAATGIVALGIDLAPFSGHDIGVGAPRPFEDIRRSSRYYSWRPVAQALDKLLGVLKHTLHICDGIGIPITDLLVEPGRVRKHQAHVSDGGCIPIEFSIEVWCIMEHLLHGGYASRIPVSDVSVEIGLAEHVVHAFYVARVPISEVPIEQSCAREHAAHVRHGARVPRIQIPVEVHGYGKHAAHVPDVRCAPTIEVLVEFEGADEHSVHACHRIGDPTVVEGLIELVRQREGAVHLLHVGCIPIIEWLVEGQRALEDARQVGDLRT